MDAASRLAVYFKTNQKVKLTPAQRRRWVKKLRRAHKRGEEV